MTITEDAAITPRATSFSPIPTTAASTFEPRSQTLGTTPQTRACLRPISELLVAA
jgi:hypothetical protein